MNIVIAGGKNKADYLIGSLLKQKHNLVVINDDPDYCEYLSFTHHIPVLNGDPGKPYVLEDAEIENFDVIIALKPNDADNLAICQTAKKLYHVRRTAAVVTNPKNVDVFKRLGINVAISATYIISNYIERVSTLETLVNSLSVEEGKIILSELVVEKNSPVANKCLKDMDFDTDIIISCILRGSEMIVPTGKTEILPNDKLIILSSADKQHQIAKNIMGENNG